jgi:hypothetical protein
MAKQNSAMWLYCADMQAIQQAEEQPPSLLLLLLLLLPLQLRTFCNANEPAKKLTELLGSWLDELTTQQVSCHMQRSSRQCYRQC